MARHKKTVYKWFDAIIQETINNAESIQCSFEEFIEGLKRIENAVKTRRINAETELNTTRDSTNGTPNQV